MEARLERLTAATERSRKRARALGWANLVLLLAVTVGTIVDRSWWILLDLFLLGVTVWILWSTRPSDG